VVWEPFALAVVMGLLVSAAIYFVVMWPQVEPPEVDAHPGAEARPDAPPAGATAGEPADDALSSRP